MKNEKNMMKCVNALACQDSCGHKVEHELNGGCLQSCWHMLGEKTCVIVKGLKDANKSRQNKSGRIANPRMPKRKLSTKVGKKSSTRKRISK